MKDSVIPSRDIRVCFAGDSLTAGTGDETSLGGVGRVTAAGIAAGLDLTSYNLGVRGATSVQVVRRLAIEARLRLTAGEPRIIQSFGVKHTHPDNLLPIGDTVGALRAAQRHALESR
ncbi:SGNH/GDSL hydrolase family protein [uncultured Amnibacterium sp.]|uniref:SGNH/GDSL hydrolase family protein n=1 Tax=uncultured Amnibacterium sp. TaxID=1631851 RepID=UPI0035CA110B